MQNQPKKTSRKKWLILAAVLVIVAGAGLAWWLTHRSDTAKPVKTQTGTATPSLDVPDSRSSDTTNTGTVISGSDGSSSPSNDAAANTPGQTSPGVQPAKPIGQFTSSNNVTANENMNSVCTTTPGAQCQIRFTMGGTVKALPAQGTNANGSISWDWNVHGIGLTEGTWKVTAVALNGDKTTANNDWPNLVVTQ